MKTETKGLILFLAVLAFSWTFNVKKLTECDFEKPYRCEIVHIIGIIPIVPPVFVWFDSDRVEKNEKRRR